MPYTQQDIRTMIRESRAKRFAKNPPVHIACADKIKGFPKLEAMAQRLASLHAACEALDYDDPRLAALDDKYFDAQTDFIIAVTNSVKA